MENIIQEIMKRLDTLARSECFEKNVKNLDSYEKVKGRSVYPLDECG